MKSEPELTPQEISMLQGSHGKGVQKAMEIVVGLARIYNAKRLIPVTSAQIAGVSYDNLGEAGLHFLSRLAADGAVSVIPATLNPAGMDLEDWQNLGIPEDFARKQKEVILAYQRLGISITCSCTPYLIGHTPLLGEHIAWSESSAVCYANSVLGARTNREGGPSALASAITGRTGEYGFHLDENRKPDLRVVIEASLPSGDLRTSYFGLLGKIIGEKIITRGVKALPWIEGIDNASLEELKSFSASIATYGGLALFHIAGITPEANAWDIPAKSISIRQNEIEQSLRELEKGIAGKFDFFSLGCPHLSLREIETIANLVKGKKIHKDFWLTTARQTKLISDQMGYTEIIEASGIKFAADTCCVVAPIKNRFNYMATDSAKACYYGRSKNNMEVSLLPIETILQIATSPQSH